MKRLNAFLLALLLLGSGVAFSAEESTLTTPVASPSWTTCKLDRITIDISAKTVHYQVLTNKGEPLSKVYNGTTTPTGATLLTAINKMNFAGANPSMVKATFNRLALDGICVGTVAGTPD